MAHYTLLPGRPVRSDINSTYLGSILATPQLRVNRAYYSPIFPPRTKMANLSNNSIGDSNPGSLDRESGIQCAKSDLLITNFICKNVIQ